jgi:nickel-dependent lactate racemase
MIGKGSAERPLTEEQAHEIVAGFAGAEKLSGRRVLVLIPDGTRHAPIPLLFRLLWNEGGRHAACLHYLVALGTHPPMTEAALDRLVGVPAGERARRYPGVEVKNHAWQSPGELASIGTIPKNEVAELTGGLLHEPIPVTLNRSVLEYDLILICGPVFPHEVVGYSGGAKYLFPGIAGAEIINATHWLGALVTSMDTIGVKDTPVRRVIHRAASLVPGRVKCLAMAVHDQELYGLYGGGYEEAWSAAADLSAKLDVVNLDRPVRRVLSMPSAIYDDLWTAAKAMYKLEPAIADGGEVVIYAPHLTEISYTHGALIDEVGYHVRDYFTSQAKRFGEVPGMIKAHSTHVKGKGTYDPATGEERPRIRVTLATAIPEERCGRVNLGYLDPLRIRIEEWEGRLSSGVLVVHNAGEQLYRAPQ